MFVLNPYSDPSKRFPGLSGFSVSALGNQFMQSWMGEPTRACALMASCKINHQTLAEEVIDKGIPWI